MAKRSTRKQAVKKRSTTAKRASTTKARRAKTRGGPRKRTAAPKKTVARKKTAARKNAARAAASRSTKKRTAPAAAKKPSTLGAIGTAVRGTVAGAVAAVARRVSSGRSTDAIALLESDHRRMEDLLKRGEETTERAVQGRRELLDQLTAELTVHELIEEQVLYPALQAHPEAKDIVLEGFQEHHVADLIVKELREVATDNEQWGAKFKVLKENIEHHIEEEEGEMFRTARAVLSQEDLDAMGAQMAAMKAQARTA